MSNREPVGCRLIGHRLKVNHWWAAGKDHLVNQKSQARLFSSKHEAYGWLYKATLESEAVEIAKIVFVRVYRRVKQ